MENYTNNKDTYIQRMNQTAKSKFAVIEPYLSKGMKILDFGSGISPEFISDIDSTGAEYYAYDISKTVQTELARMGVNVVTKDDLTNKEVQFDIIYLSSVFHEIISYLNRQERTETIPKVPLIESNSILKYFLSIKKLKNLYQNGSFILSKQK